MSVQVFIDGAAGTTGLEIRDRLADRRDVTLVTLPDARRRNPAARADALNAADIVILCLPDDAAREAVAMIDNGSTRIIDASSAHRIDPDWIYGFAELEPDRRDAIRTAMRVSNPGCYPTGFLALARPLVRAGLLPADAPLTVNAVSGYSGGGKAMIAAFEDAAPGAPVTAWRSYALSLGHKHAPEMQVNGGLAHAPVFAPSVARAYRGMVVEVPLNLAAMANAPSVSAIRQTLTDAYADSVLVRVADSEGTAAAETIMIERAAGTDRIELFVFSDEACTQVRLVAALDNLGKGAAGAAVQNLNLMAGVDEPEGLRL